MRRGGVRHAGALAVALVAGCIGDPASSVDPTLATRRIGVGQEQWTVIVGSSDGMRGRTDLGGADGMLFDLGREVDPRGTKFTMAGVSIPLDIAWFDGSGALVGSASMPPCEADPCPVYAPDRPYRWAIEAPVGAFDGVDLSGGLSLLDEPGKPG